MLVVSVERLDSLPDFLKPCFNYRAHISNPEKDDRISILKWLLPEQDTEIDFEDAQKYLQGKTFKDIQNIVHKIKRSKLEHS